MTSAFGADTFDEDDFGIVGITKVGDKKTPDAPAKAEPTPEPTADTATQDVPVVEQEPGARPTPAKRRAKAPASIAPIPPSEPAVVAEPVKAVRRPATRSAVAWPTMPTVDATVGAGDAAAKLSNRWDKHLLVLVEQTLMRWLVDSGSSMPSKQRLKVGQSTIMEALLRVGLLHLDDPDLVRLVRADGRQRPLGEPDFGDIADGLPPTCDPWAAGLQWLHFDGTLTRHTGYCREGLMDALEEVRMRWYVRHSEFATLHGSKPGEAAFREGLIRLGVKHLTTADIDKMLTL